MVGHSSIHEVRSNAKELRENGSYAEALVLYESLWNETGRRESWDGWGAAFCLRKLSRPRDAVRYCREVESQAESFKPAYGLHAWCLYDAYLRKPADRPAGELLSILGAISNCADKSDRYGEYSALVRSVFRVVGALKDPYRPAEILDALGYLDPTRLTDSFDTIDVRGKARKILSKRERYFQALTKALQKTERWRECADACVVALDSVPVFRGEGLMWIERRLAVAVLNDGDAEHAAALMRDVLTRLDNWFLFDDLAQAEIALGELDEARRHIRRALQSPGKIEMKVGTLRRMADLDEQLGDFDSACLHARLAQAIRLENEWSTDAEVEGLLARLECGPAPVQRRELENELKTRWKAS